MSGAEQAPLTLFFGATDLEIGAKNGAPGIEKPATAKPQVFKDSESDVTLFRRGGRRTNRTPTNPRGAEPS